MIVLDALATIALLLNEDNFLAGSEQLIDLVEEAIVVPSHWAAEIGNALVINVRRGRLEQTEGELMTERLSALGIGLEPPHSFLEFALIAHQEIECGLTYYDAAYVRTAQLRQASLFTFDWNMRAAASRLNISLLPV